MFRNIEIDPIFGTQGNGGGGVLAESIRFYRIDVIPRIFSLRRISKEISARGKKERNNDQTLFVYLYFRPRFAFETRNISFFMSSFSFFWGEVL